MLKIKKLRADRVIDFAAEELNKYLRTMMPEVNEIEISLDPEAKDGFRLGLLEDFGLPCEAEDIIVDDIVHLDTDAGGGILAGSNPRSVLFAVYRLLKENGCRFLFPGVDGEYIPRKELRPVKYHKLPDHRFRGHTIEGDPSIHILLDYIDYHAKQELNLFAVSGIFAYQRRYYNHRYNEKNRPPEPIDFEQAQQWRGLCEAECVKRGLLLQSGGHSEHMQAIGINPEDRLAYKSGEKQLPEEARPYLAMINGKRELQHNDPVLTGICLSQPEVRSKFARFLADNAAEKKQYLTTGVPRQDGTRNYCECEECKKLRPSDWVVMVANELDELLTEKGVNKKINLSTYVDCMFPPVKARVKNPNRYMLQYTPISRSYTSSINEDTVFPEPKPFVYNGWEAPKRIEEYTALYKEWQKALACPGVAFEYHYWVHQYRDPGMMQMSRRIYEDVRSYKLLGIEGCKEDGSNRSFFPNGFISHIYSETLLNRDCNYDAVLADYFYHIYGDDWKLVKEYLDGISAAFDHRFMCGELGVPKKVKNAVDVKGNAGAPVSGSFYNPAHAESLSEVKELTARIREQIKKHMAMPTRPQTVSWRLLLHHAEYCEHLAEVMTEKCLGHDRHAKAMWLEFLEEFGKHEFEFERYFDFGLAARSIDVVLDRLPEIEL